MKEWTFDTKEIAESFDSHVREQLPWYEMVTEAVAYITRNYLPKNGMVLDIGSSTGNTAHKLMPLLIERGAHFYGIEKSDQMYSVLTKRFEGNSHTVFVNKDATGVTFPKCDVAIMFLTMMFVPVDEREGLYQKLVDSVHTGGCVIIVDKINHDGYFGTVMKRLTMEFKRHQHAKSADILDKEMSLAGVQRPIEITDFDWGFKEFFRFGEFAGWVLEL
jgi:tRNA (cmo5U34)-methyltransferase